MSALDEDKVVEMMILDTAEMDLLNQLREARAEKKSWEEQEGRCRAALLDAVGSANTLLYQGDIVANIEKRSSRRWNRKLFAKDWAALDAMEEYNTVSESTVINLIGTTEEPA